MNPLNSTSRDSTSVTTISSWEKASLSTSKSSTPTELIKLVVNRLSLNQTFDDDAVESSPSHPVLRVENLTGTTPDSGRLLIGGKLINGDVDTNSMKTNRIHGWHKFIYHARTVF